MINVPELKAAMVRRGYNQKAIADKLGMSYQTLSRKMHKGVFGTDEVEKMISLLCIEDPVPIFFAKEVTA